MSPLVLTISACGSRSERVTWRRPAPPHGYMIKRVPSRAHDWLYILAEDGSEYLIRDCLHGRRSITLTPAYLLGAVAESG